MRALVIIGLAVATGTTFLQGVVPQDFTAPDMIGPIGLAVVIVLSSIALGLAEINETLRKGK